MKSGAGRAASLAFFTACASLIALILLCLAWELWLAPQHATSSEAEH